MGPDTPRKPRDGFSRPGGEQHSAPLGRARHRAAERAPPVARSSGTGSARDVRARRDENRPGACGRRKDEPGSGVTFCDTRRKSCVVDSTCCSECQLPLWSPFLLP